MGFRTAGKKVEKELINLCELYIGKIPHSKNKLKQNKELGYINEKYLAFFDIEFNTLYENQSNDVKQIIKYITKYNLSLTEYHKATFGLTLYDFQSIKGLKSFELRPLLKFHDEVQSMLDKNVEFIDNNTSYFNEKTDYLDAILEIIKIFRLDIEESKQFVNDDGQILVFSLLNYLMNVRYFVENGFLSENGEILWFKYLLYHKKTKSRNLELIGKEFEHPVSRERARQIRDTTINRFNYIFNKISLISKKHLVHYGIMDEKYIFVDKSIEDKINKEENTQYTSLLITKVFGLLLKDSHSIFGNEKIIHKGSLNRKNFKYLHIVPNNVRLFLFQEDLLFDLEKRFTKKITESYYLDFSEYIVDNSMYKRLIDKDLYDLQEVLKSILYREFGIRIVDGKIFFEKNTQKLAWEYAYEILKGKEPNPEGYHIDEIKSDITSNYPDFNLDSLQSSLVGAKSKIRPVGRNSRYIIKEWELEFPDLIKGGSIRKIVVEYLQKFDLPQPISEITKYVQKYRPTTYEHSIKNNLSIDKSGTFVLYETSHIGLSGKESSFRKRTSNKDGLKELIIEFIDFIKTNNSLPNEIEHPQLYNFYKRYRMKYSRKRLKSENKKLIESIGWDELDKLKMSANPR